MIGEWKRKIWAKREVAKARIKGAQVIIVGEHHTVPQHALMEFELIRAAKPSILAVEELEEGKPPAKSIRNVAKNLEYLEKTVSEVAREHGYEFPGFEGAFHDRPREHAEKLLQIAKKIYERRNKENPEVAFRKVNALLTAAEILSEADNPAFNVAFRNALLYRRRPVVGIDRDAYKERQITAVKKGDMKAFRKINAVRNRIMAKNVAEIVKQGHTPLVIVGAKHAPKIAEILEKEHGIRAHVVVLPHPLSSVKNVEELLEYVDRTRRYYESVAGK